MVFSSLVFLYAFFPINIVFYFICKNNTYRNIVLLGFSLLFYAWGEPFFVCVMVFSCLINYILAVLIDEYRGSYKCKLALTAAVAIDLALLGYFKYYNFFVDNVNLLLNTGINSNRVGLPIGISFYTFQIISYVVDVYRKDVPVQNKFYKLLLYMSLYHHIMAGPIVRYRDIEREIDSRIITPYAMSYGITRFYNRPP